MSKIRGKNTKPELIIRSLLFRQGFRFRIHQKNLHGQPDIVLAKYRTAIFVHGCFWHNHKDCKEGRVPSTNSKFWKDKLERNIRRDEANIRALTQDKWKVIVVWECEIEKHLDKTLKNLIRKIRLDIS